MTSVERNESTGGEATGIYEATCPCGFAVKSSSLAAVVETFENHACASESEPWYAYAFGFWGFAIVLAIGWVIVRLVAG